MCFRNLSQFSGKQIFEFLPNFLSIPQYCIGGGGRDVEPINLVCPEFHYGLVRQPHESQELWGNFFQVHDGCVCAEMTEELGRLKFCLLT